MRGNGLSVLVFLFASVLMHAQAPPQTPPVYPVIAGITVEGLSVGEDMQTVIAYSGLRVGMEARPDELMAAVRNLWNRRNFRDVRIEKERETALGVFLIIRVSPMPRLRRITIVGNDEISTQDIEKVIARSRGDLISPYDAYLARQRVRKLYETEGMLFAKITSTMTGADSANFYDMTITIDEGVEYHVESIEFTGNALYSDGDYAGAFEDTKTKSWWQVWKSSKFDASKYAADKDRLRSWFMDKGLLDAAILDDTVIYNETNETVTIRIDLYEGKPVYIRSIHFTGNTVYTEGQLLSRLGIDPGEVYDQTMFTNNLNINQDQTDATSLYSDNGYLTASLQPDLIRVGEDSVDIVVRVFEGDRYTVRRVEIVGNSKTRDRVVRRELYTRPGDYFNRSAIIRSIRGLGVLNYFNPETLKPDVLKVDNTRVDLIYKVEERSTDTFNASVGFAGAVGLTGSVGITLNNFDITQPLRGGGGQVLSFQWEFGQASRSQSFQISFTEPWLLGEPTSLGFNVYDTRQNYNISFRQTGAQLNIGRRFRFPDDYFRGDWSIAFDRIESSNASVYYRQGVNTSLKLSQTISRTSFDNVVFPTSGSRFALSTRITTGFLGIGTTDYFKVGLSYDVVNPLFSIDGFPRLVLMLSSEMGYLNGIKSDTTIPPNELFYMGGNGLGGFAITPLRGYRDNTVGPLSGGGIGAGGRVQARLLAELRFSLTLNPFPIYLLSFAEAGNVWESLQTADPFGLKRSAGVGLRILLNPIGLLGFDLGYGFDIDPGTGQRSGWQFHFQFGR